MPTPTPTPAAQFGRDYRLQFAAADGTSPVPLAGEKSFDWSRAGNDVDTSDKDGASGLYIPGRVSFSVSGTVKLPDPGLSQVYAACKTGSPIQVTVQQGAVVKYKGLVSCGNWKGSFDRDDKVPFSFDMTASSPAAVDDLGATA